MRRVEHIDIAKGFSILFVAMFHSPFNSHLLDFFDSMALFRMPLFFLLSGVFFVACKSPKEFLLKKSEALLKPYFFVLLFVYMFYVALGANDLGGMLVGIFYGSGETIITKWTPMWFLTHLFVVYCFAYALFKFFRFNAFPLVVRLVFLLILFFVGSLYVDFFWGARVDIFSYSFVLPGLPFSLDLLFVTSFYFLLGSLLKTYLIGFQPRVVLIALSVCVFLYVSIFTAANVDLNNRVYSFPFYATLGAFSGIYIVLSVSFFVAKNKLFSFVVRYIGQSSLFILLFHGFIGRAFYSLLSKFISTELGLLILSIVSFLVSVVLPIIIKYLVERSNILSLVFLPVSSNKLLQR